MNNIWKTIFIGLTALLVGSFTFGIYFWPQVSDTRNQLDNSLTELNDTRAELITTGSLLATAETQLADIETQLADIETQLADTETQLVDTETQLANTETQLVDTEAQLNTAEVQLFITEAQLETEKDNNSQLLNQYSGFKRQIANRIGATKQDRQGFITPENYLVSEKAQEITGGYSEDINEYWRDLYRLYQWVVNNISYSYDSSMPVLPEVMSGELTWRGEYWRLPEETLEEETGDCEDMATLLVSLMRSYNEGKFAVWAVTISSGVPGNVGHVGAAFPVENGKLTIVDPTGNYYTGYGSLEAKSSSVAVNQWLAHWESDIPEAFISGVFTDDFYYEFSNTDEFLAWVMDR